MMDAITAIETRRSVKEFDPACRIREADVERLMSLAMRSPTAFNIQHWRFVLIDDPVLRERIRAVSCMQPQVTDASLLVVVCADLQAWNKQPERYWKDLPENKRQGIVKAMTGHYRDNPQRQRDEAMRSCGIAAQTLMIAARAMGYDSCPMDLSDFSEVAKLIRLPEDHVIGLFVAIGKATRAPWPRSGQLAMDEVVFRNHF